MTIVIELSYILFPRRVRGSKASRSPSPKKLKESTVRKMKALGKRIRCGCVRSDRQPSDASVPQLQAGGDKPRPMKLKVDSDTIAAGTMNVSATIIGPI